MEEIKSGEPKLNIGGRDKAKIAAYIVVAALVIFLLVLIGNAAIR